MHRLDTMVHFKHAKGVDRVHGLSQKIQRKKTRGQNNLRLAQELHGVFSNLSQRARQLAAMSAGGSRPEPFKRTKFGPKHFREKAAPEAPRFVSIHHQPDPKLIATMAGAGSQAQPVPASLSIAA